MRVLSWNLYHGRDFPPDPALLTLRSRLLRLTERDATHAQVNRPLLPEFALLLDRWEWDVALLQEAPPRWFRRSRGAPARAARSALTSRNLVPALQWRAGRPQPRSARLERRRLEPDARAPSRTDRRDAPHAPGRAPRAPPDALDAGGAAGGPRLRGEPARERGASRRRPPRRSSAPPSRRLEWAGGDALVLGGDFNLRPRRDPEPFVLLRERFGLGEPTAPGAIDHLLARGLDVIERPRRLEPAERELTEPDGRRIRLSDHAPVVARFGLP